jgi:hypothetical protein
MIYKLILDKLKAIIHVNIDVCMGHSDLCKMPIIKVGNAMLENIIYKVEKPISV